MCEWVNYERWIANLCRRYELFLNPKALFPLVPGVAMEIAGIEFK